MTGQDAAKRADNERAKAGLTYGELLTLTEGHGTGVIYKRIIEAIDAAVAEAVAKDDAEDQRDHEAFVAYWRNQVAEAVNEQVRVDDETCAKMVAEARREEREGVIRMCDEHDNQCLDPQGCDVSTISAALRARPTANEHGL